MEIVTSPQEWGYRLTNSPYIVKIGEMSVLDHKFPPDLTSLYNQRLANQLAITHAAIAGLNQMSKRLQNPTLLMRPILAKEAESSAQLEGTQASIDDAYKIDVADQSPEKRNEALEIRNYEDAMLHGIEIIEVTGVNALLIREMHKTLMQGVRGQKKHPGEYRTGDVWVGALGTTKEKARYLPPDAAHIPQLMNELLNFIKVKKDMHPLLACGIIHHRFEAIHPFEDGNGRTGRLIISLYLISQGLIDLPILYPSGYFERNKDEYISALAQVDNEENWYTWLLYFLKGMEQQAGVSLNIANKIDTLFKTSRAKIEDERANLNLIRVLEHTFVKPYVTSAILNKDLDIPRTTCERYLQTLSEKEIVLDLGIIKRQKVFVNAELIKLLNDIN
jgi:Fic family protein